MSDEDDGDSIEQTTPDDSSGGFDVSSGDEPSSTNVPFDPPAPPPQPEMRPRDGSDSPDLPEGPEHDLEDTRTVDSIGEGQDEETPEAP